MVFELPTFKGFTVDKRLREFRRVDKIHGLVFVPFDSLDGRTLLAQMKDYFYFLYEGLD